MGRGQLLQKSVMARGEAGKEECNNQRVVLPGMLGHSRTTRGEHRNRPPTHRELQRGAKKNMMLEVELLTSTEEERKAVPRPDE